MYQVPGFLFQPNLLGEYLLTTQLFKCFHQKVVEWKRRATDRNVTRVEPKLNPQGRKPEIRPLLCC